MKINFEPIVTPFPEGNLSIGAMIHFVVNCVPTHWSVHGIITSRSVAQDRNLVEYTISSEKFKRLCVEVSNYGTAKESILWYVIGGDKKFALKSISLVPDSNAIEETSEPNKEDELLNMPLLSDDVKKFEYSEDVDFYENIRKFEEALIRNALTKTGGHQGRAARLLGLNATTLNSKLKIYEIKTSSSITNY